MNFITTVIDKTHTENIDKGLNLELNGVRGFACLLIVLFHCWSLSGTPNLQPALGYGYYLPAYGAYAVDLFFVLSGFFIILPYVHVTDKPVRKLSLWTYYRKKFVRIFPPYYLNLLFMFGVMVPAILGIDYLRSDSGINMLLAHLTFLQYMHPSTSSSLGMNGALWTLSITFQFFLVFPLIKNLFVGGRELLFLLVFIVISVLWKYFCWYDTHTIFPLAFNTVKHHGVDELTIRLFLANQLPSQLAHFGIGMFLGSVYMKKQKVTLLPRTAFCILALIGFVTASYSFRIANLAVPPWWHWWRLWLAVGSGCLIYLTAINGPQIFKSVFRNKYLGFIGNLSYEIYLWHLLILYLLKKTFLPDFFSSNLLFGVFLLLCGAITLTISYGSQLLTAKIRRRSYSLRPNKNNLSVMRETDAESSKV